MSAADRAALGLQAAWLRALATGAAPRPVLTS